MGGDSTLAGGQGYYRGRDVVDVGYESAPVEDEVEINSGTVPRQVS